MKDLSILGELANGADEELDELIYPINIHESLRVAGSMKTGEKTSIAVSFWIFGNGIAAWLLASWLRTVAPQHYILITVLILLLIQATLGVYLLGFILDERGMAAEMNQSDMLFTNYFNIYRELVEGEDSPYPFDVLEFTDGSHVVYLQCLLGYNTQEKSNGTYTANIEVEQMLNRAGFQYRKLFSNERFKGSIAAEQLLSTMKRAEDPRLFQAYRQVLMGLMDIAENESNVLCVTYVIHARTRIEKDDLVSVVNKALSILRRDNTVYREVNILNYDECVEFLRRAYNLDVLDMGLVRARQAVKKHANCSIRLLKLKGSSGKVYATKDNKRLQERILQDYGLL